MDDAPPTAELSPAGAGPSELGPRAADLPHAPEVGWAKRLLGRYHVTGVFWFRFHFWGISIVPKWGVGAIVALFTPFFFICLIKVRRARPQLRRARAGRGLLIGWRSGVHRSRV